MRVALFLTCFNDVLFPDVGLAARRLLTHLGQDVDIPAGQTCCAQMHFNTGYRDDCIPLVARFARVFSGYDAVVTPSASCAAMVRLHHSTVAESARNPALQDAVSAVTPKVYELSEFLVDVLGVGKVGGQFHHTVAFHPTCHSIRHLRLGDRPVELLRSVDGLRLVELPGADECCGFGGTFAVKNAAASVAMGSDKAIAIEASGAEVLASADTSCLLHLGGLLSRRGSSARVMHFAEILAAGLP